jgi:hypothetical protein
LFISIEEGLQKNNKLIDQIAAKSYSFQKDPGPLTVYRHLTFTIPGFWLRGRKRKREKEVS